MKQCHGLIITSFTKSDIKTNLEKELGKTMDQYKDYIKYQQFPFYLKGKKIVVVVIL